MQYTGTVKATATPHINVRSTPEVTATNDIGDLLPGQAITADDLQNGWLHILTPQVGWVSAAYVDYQTVPTTTVKVPFTLSVDGFKSFSGELEKA